MNELFQRADKAVRELSDGQFFLELDGLAVYLVKTATREKALLPPSNGRALTNAGRLDRIAALSERERQVFKMLGDAVEMREIAERMNVSVKTVETYRARLKQKLEVKNRILLLALAVEWRLAQAPSTDGQPMALSSHDGDGHSDGKPGFPISKDGNE